MENLALKQLRKRMDATEALCHEVHALRPMLEAVQRRGDGLQEMQGAISRLTDVVSRLVDITDGILRKQPHRFDRVPALTGGADGTVADL